MFLVGILGCVGLIFFVMGPASVVIPLVCGVMVVGVLACVPAVAAFVVLMYIRLATMIAAVFHLTTTPVVIFGGFFNTGGMLLTSTLRRWVPRLRETWFLPAFVNMVRTVCFAMVGWIWAFIRAFLHFWTLLYATLIIFFFVGVLMYPFLMVERYPETGVEAMDMIVDVLREGYNVAASVFNVSFAIFKPFLPVYNLEVRFVVQMLRVVMDFVGHLVGAVFAAFSTDGWGDAETRDAHRLFDTTTANQPGVGSNFDEYTRSCLSIVLTMCRIFAVVGDILVDLFEVLAIYFAHVMETFFSVFVWVIQVTPCCVASPFCCLREIGAQTIGKIPFPSPIGDFVLFSACSDGECGADCRCSSSYTAGVGATQWPMLYSRKTECGRRTWKCTPRSENGDMWGDISSSGCMENPRASSIFFGQENGCPFWKENREVDSCKTRRRLQDRSEEEHREALTLWDSTSCYSECEDGRTYDVCVSTPNETEPFHFRQRGTCRLMNATARRLSPVLGSEEEEEDSKAVYERLKELANADSNPPLKCHQLLKEVRKLSDDWTTWPLHTMMHYTICLVKQSSVFSSTSEMYEHLNERVHDITEWTDTLSTVRILDHTKRKMETVNVFVRSLSDHVGDAIGVHTTTYVPRSDDWLLHKDRVKHFAHSVNTHGVRRAWDHMLKTLDTIYDTQPGPRRRRKPKPKHANASKPSGFRTMKTSRRLTFVSSDNVFQPDTWNGDRATNFGGGMVRETREYVLFDEEGACPSDSPHRCPDGRSCVESSDVAPDECPIAVSTEGWYEWWYSTMYWLRYMFDTSDFNVVIHILFQCWDDLEQNPHLDPYSRDNMWRLGNFFDASSTRQEPDDFRWCFPMIPPSATHWYFPKMVWDVVDFITAECDTTNEVCFCDNYATPKETFEADAYWFWFIPVYVFARAKNAFLSAQFLLTFYLTAGSFLDDFWTWFWMMLWPTGPKEWLQLWGDQGQESATRGFICIFLHFGSLLYVMFWSYVGLLFYRCFFSFGVLIVSDLTDIFLWGWDNWLVWAQSSFLIHYPGYKVREAAVHDESLLEPPMGVFAAVGAAARGNPATFRRHASLHHRSSQV